MREAAVRKLDLIRMFNDRAIIPHTPYTKIGLHIKKNLAAVVAGSPSYRPCSQVHNQNQIIDPLRFSNDGANTQLPFPFLAR
jgi:hypothetical protein